MGVPSELRLRGTIRRMTIFAMPTGPWSWRAGVDPLREHVFSLRARGWNAVGCRVHPYDLRTISTCFPFIFVQYLLRMGLRDFLRPTYISIWIKI